MTGKYIGKKPNCGYDYCKETLCRCEHLRSRNGAERCRRSLNVTSVDLMLADAEADTSSHVIAAYIHAYSDRDGLIIDPFVRSPKPG